MIVPMSTLNGISGNQIKKRKSSRKVRCVYEELIKLADCLIGYTVYRGTYGACRVL